MQVVFQIHLSLVLTESKSEGLKSVSEGFGYGDTVDKWFSYNCNTGPPVGLDLDFGYSKPLKENYIKDWKLKIRPGQK
jgi:hypothetical protein